VPRSFQIVSRENKDTSRSVLFLSRRADNKLDLFHCTTQTLQTPEASVYDEESGVPTVWRRLCQLPSADTDSKSATMSKEEELLRERMRERESGITSYKYNADKNRVMVPSGGQLYTSTLPNDLASVESPIVLQKLGKDTTQSGAKLDGKFSPDCELVSFVRNGEVWVCSVETGVELQLTHTEAGKTAGLPEYIIQEEFDRYTGYWWSPQVRKNENGDEHTYSLLYLEVDETKVPRVSIADPVTGTADNFVFPRPGEQNATSRVRVVQFTISDHNALANATVTTLGLVVAIEDVWSDCEYIPRAHWTPNGDSFLLQLVDRKQQQLKIAQVNVSQHMAELTVNPVTTGSSSAMQIVHEESSDIWINTTNIFAVLSDNDTIVFASERTGFRQLYTKKLSQGTAAVDTCISGSESSEFVVLDAPIRVDEKSDLVYFSAKIDTPLESQLCAARLSASNGVQVQRVTEAGCSHSFMLDQSMRFVVTSHSSVAQLPQTHVLTIEPTASDASDLVRATKLVEVPHRRFKLPDDFDYVTPELCDVQSGDLTLHACVYKPRSWDAANPTAHPTLIYTYGGPHVQLVTNSYSLTANHRLQMLTKLGYVVAIVDGRGSYNRGLAFEGHLRLRMGQVEIQDQVALVDMLIARGLSDAKRIGVFGWSYGGYMALLAMSQRPDVFKVGVSGAPVVSWEFYDTGYTERYMDTPQNAPDAYAKGSVLEYADNFPDEENRLLIVHGLIDENVHFTHTAQLLNCLVERNKPYVLKVFPKERHGIRNPTAASYFELFFLRFLKQHL
jgi:dipeptidyl-peptidase 9